MAQHYNYGLVALSVLVAWVAAYTTVDIALRVREAPRHWVACWLIGGGLALGLGIWATHFIGMLAHILPEPVGYDALLTFVSVLPAVTATTLALYLIRRGAEARRVIAGAASIGAGIATMHYVGMAAMRMEPAIDYQPLLYAASWLIAMAAAAAALLVGMYLRVGGARLRRNKLLASALLGLAIPAMHYTGMAAAVFAPGSVSLALADGGLQRETMAVTVGFAALLISVIALSGAATDARRVNLTQAANRVLDEDRRRLLRLFDQAPGFVVVLRGAGQVVELANEALYSLVGRREMLGRPLRESVPEMVEQGLFRRLDKVRAVGEPFVARGMAAVFHRPEDGEPYHTRLDVVFQPIIDSDGSVSGVFVQGNDVSEIHQLADQLRHQAAHDALTGLVNRREFEKRLVTALAAAEHGATACHALLYIDLDQFKVVNDSCGHAAGDELLRQLAALLRQRLRRSDTLARLGGDEFAVLALNCEEERAERIAGELLKLIRDFEFNWQQRRFVLSASIGLVGFGGRDGQAEAVLRTADNACHLAKEKGRNRVHVYRPGDAEIEERLRQVDWVSRLRVALREQRFQLYFQRIEPAGGDDPRLRRQELLLRLRDETGELVPPMAFIPAAERYDLMPVLDRWVVATAFRHLAGLPPALRRQTWLSINLSGTTLADDRFLEYVQAQLAEHAPPAAQICFEITETAAIGNLSEARRLIDTLRTLGFRFALDDFGSGMSSFGYLKQLSVDYVKIDGAFVRNVLQDPVERAMIEAVTRVVGALGIETIAEYVESGEVRAELHRLGVDYVQGFGIHRPEALAVPALPRADSA